MAILAERRATMYDPLVVDTFVRIHRQLIGAGEADVVASPGADQHRTTEETSAGLVSEMPTSGGLALFNLYQVLCDFGDRPWDDGADLVVYRLSQVLPVAACAVFAYNQTSDTLVCQSAHGPGLASLRGSRRRLGEGLSGWVAANRRPVINSIPALDLADLSKDAAANLNSTLSVPLSSGDALVGVFTVYATSEQAFSAYHKQVLEGIAPHVATLVRRSQAFAALADQALPGYPGASHLDKYIRQRLQNRRDPAPVARRSSDAWHQRLRSTHWTNRPRLLGSRQPSWRRHGLRLRGVDASSACWLTPAQPLHRRFKVACSPLQRPNPTSNGLSSAIVCGS